MSDAPQGPGWWQASDGRWYPPQPTPPPTSAPPPTAPIGPPPQYTPPPYGAVPTPPPGTPLGTPAPGYGPPTAPPGTPAPGHGPPTAPPGGFGPPTAPPNGPAPKAKGNGGLYAVLAVIAFVAIAGTALFFVVSGDDGGGDGPDPTRPDEEVAAAIILLPIVVEGPDAFGASFSSPELPEISNAAADVAASTRSGLDDDASGALVSNGSSPGLFGGSRVDQVCDAEAVADFLEGDAEKGAAFAGVLGIGNADVRAYLVGLTPVILLSDTWVTDHGFTAGRASARQAVLQAGSAVLVDVRGVPRVRCASGSPLTAPTRQGRSTASTEGDEWDGFDPDQVTVVEAGDPLSTLTLVDVASGEEFDRAPGAGQTGDVQVTLQWSTGADLDLHVFDPDGTEVYFNSDDDPTGGTLDIDVIPSCDEADETHSENVFWPEGAAPSGTYRIEVVNYTDCDAGAVEFTVQAFVRGELVLDEGATVDADATNSDFTFSA